MKFFITLFAALLLTTTAAQAATIELGAALGSFEPYINAVVSIGVTVLVGVVLWQLKTRFNIEIDAGHRATLMTWASNQAAALVAKGMVSVKEAKVEVRSEALANAANTALQGAPDAAQHFGLTPEALKTKIVEQLVKQPSVAAALAESQKA